MPDTWNSLAANVTHKDLVALAAGTLYDFRVRANYAEGDSDPAEIQFTTEATCLVPEGLAVNNMVATWTAGTASQWNLQYKKSTEATWTPVNDLTAATFDFNNLTLDATTNYEVQVQANCGNDDLSAWSESVTFRTPCGIETIDATHSWSEGFESYNQGTSTSSGVAVTEIECWERVSVNSSTNSPFVYRNYQSAASTGLASLELKTGTSAVMVALPQFSAPIQSLNVAFNYNCTTTTYTYTAELGYITDVADATTFVKLFDIPTPVTRGNHSTFSQDLYEAAAAANAPAGSRVAIRFASSYEYTNYPPSWNLDDFVVSYVSDCHKPAGLAITDGSITPYGATATWTGTNDSYKVMIGQENITINADFESNSIPADFTNDATYPWTVATGGANNSGHCIIPGNHNVHSCNSDLTLEVNLASPATISFWAKISSEGTDYGRFLLDGTQKLNISGTSSYTSWAKYEYELTAGVHTLIWRYYKDSSVNTGDDYFYVDDIVISAAPASWDEYTTTNQTYTFDNLTPNRTYQVKVKGVCGEEETPATAPVSFTTLESCPAPTGLAIAEGYPTAHGVSFTWDYEDGEVFQYALPVGDVTDPSEVNFNTTWYAGEDFPMWNNLSADTDRTFWLRKKCGDSEYSDPVSISFHSLEACPAPTNFDVDDITNHTATLSWQGTSNEYQVSYRTATYVDGLEERFDNSGLPTGWICYSGAVDGVLDGTVTLTSGSGWGTNSYALGEYNIKANIYGTGCYKWVASPEFTFNGEAVEFDVALTDFGNSDPIENVGNQDDDRFVVLVYADDEWHILREWNNSGSAYVYDEIPHTGTHVSIDLSLYSGKTIRVAFYGESTESGGDNDLHIDNVKSGTDVPAGEMQYASNLTEETVTLSNLLAERKYEAWLQGDCGSEGPSAEVGPITFKTDIACPNPTNLQIVENSVKSNRVTLSWESNYANEWVVAYKADGETDYTEVTADENPYTLTGLREETDYVVKVRSNCGSSDGLSNGWTNEQSFTTIAPCSVEEVTIANITHHTATVNWTGESASGFTVKYRTAEQVDGIEEGFSIASTTPDGWENKTGLLSTIMSGGTLASSTQWYFGEYNGVFDSHARINIYGSGSSERHGWLITPEINVGIDCVFTFDLALTAYSGNSVPAPATTGTDDRFVILISTDNKATWTILREWNNEAGAEYVYNNIANTATGENVSIDLSSYAGQSVRIAFYGESTESNADNNLHIDNVMIGTPVPAGTEQTVSATDSPANLENLEAGTKYDVKVVPNCDETMASEWQSFTTVSPNEKWFVTEGNWGTDANWEPVGAPTIDQNVTLKANATIESTCVAEAKSINGTGTGNNAYTLTIKDGGKLKHLNSSVRATVEKEIRAYSTNYDEENYNNGDYYLIANPLTSTVTPDAENNHLLSGNYDLYRWDYTQDLEWLNYKASNFNLGYGAYGYLYANETGATLTYTGTINPYSSYKSRNLSYSSSSSYSFPYWYLLGNPYLYDAYLASASTNGNALPYIKMNADGDGFVNVAAGTPIAPMEGFFYQATASGSVYVVTYVPTVQSQGKLNMNLRSDNKQLDNAILVFGGNQQLGKFSFRENSSKIYMPVEGKDLAITTAEGNVGEQPVSFKAEKNGSYTLSFTSEDVTFSYLHLIDNLTGDDVNLLANPSYTFNATTNDYANRFRLVFATGSSNDTETGTFGFVNANGNFCIFGIEGEATVQVIDILGHVISSETFSGSYERKINGAPGVYVVRLINGNDVRTQKVVVR